jgi:hypothetical protein
MGSRYLRSSLCLLLCAACGGVSSHTTAPPPPLLTAAPSVFPPPFDPWLDAPDLTALLENHRDAEFGWNVDADVTSLRRGESLRITFNRAVASELEVGRPLERMPLELSPAVRGTATFVAPHVLIFTPDASVFARPGEARFRPSPALTSRAGEVLGETDALTMVFDRTPMLVDHDADIALGRPLRFYFDAPVSAAQLKNEVLLYEIGGGMRTIGFRARGIGQRTDHGQYAVELSPTRPLVSGMEIGFAMPPRWAGGGMEPATRYVSVSPAPQLSVGNAARDALGVYVIGDALELAFTHPLTLPNASALVFVPEVRGVTVSLSNQDHTLEVRGDFQAGRTYTLRMLGLVTDQGVPIAPTRTLSVRRDPPEPSARWLSSGDTCERATPCVLDFTATNAMNGTVSWLEHVTLRAGVSGAMPRDASVGHGGAIQSVLTGGGTSEFRAAFGRVTPLAEGQSGFAVLRLDPRHPRGHGVSDYFVQRTDLATTVIALDQSIVTWVTSLTDARPLPGTDVRVIDNDREVTGRTNALGLVEVTRTEAPRWARARRTDVLARREGDESVQAFSPPTARIGTPTLRRVAILTDRGIYRPGEQIRAVAFARDVTGATGAAASLGATRMRLVATDTGQTLADVDATPTSGGRYVGALTVPIYATRSDCNVELVVVETAATVATASVRVATFDTPRSVLDLTTTTPHAIVGTPFSLDASARQLVGTPLAAAPTRVVLRRIGPAPRAHAHARFSFGDGGHVDARTEHEARLVLDAEGHANVPLPFSLDVPTRTTFRADVFVRDSVGEETASSIRFVGVPAAVEVGLALEASFVNLGQGVRADVITLDPAEALAPRRRVEVRFVEMTGQTYYEEVTGPRGTTLAARFTDRDRAVHTCNVTTAATGLGDCRFAPTRAGRYRVEAIARDDANRTSVAYASLYVSGPVDPEGDDGASTLVVRTDRRALIGGDAFEVSFSNPFADAEMLLTVTTGKLLHAERARLPAGPHVVRLVATDAMVPGARVTVVLAKPRSEPYRAPLDLGAPSVRMGTVDLGVRPAGSTLRVAITRVPESVRTAATTPITVTARDTQGRGVRGHVVVYAVDEAVLRLSGYTTPDPADAFFERPYVNGLRDRRSASAPLQALDRGALGPRVGRRRRGIERGGRADPDARALRPDARLHRGRHDGRPRQRHGHAARGRTRDRVQAHGGRRRRHAPERDRRRDTACRLADRDARALSPRGHDG